MRLEPTSRAAAATFLAGLAAVATWSSLSGIEPGAIELVPCPFHCVAGIPCPGCGMTRACVAAARGDFASAWQLHPFAFLLIPLAAALTAFPERTREVWQGSPAWLRGSLTTAAIACAMALWACRLAP